MINELMKRYPVLGECQEDIERVKDILIHAFENGGKLLLAGNGGSCADCEHIAGELMKGFMNKRVLPDDVKADMKNSCGELGDDTLSKLQNALPAIPLTSFSGLNTAFSNDVDANLVYAQSVLALGKQGDIFLGITTSGNSCNVVEAAKVAKARGLTVVALTGSSGGEVSKVADVTVRVPEVETYKVQELHLPVYHYICAAVEKHFFG